MTGRSGHGRGNMKGQRRSLKKFVAWLEKDGARCRGAEVVVVVVVVVTVPRRKGSEEVWTVGLGSGFRKGFSGSLLHYQQRACRTVIAPSA
jgi:hypothetical protein